jgi:hypothetical protein
MLGVRIIGMIALTLAGVAFLAIGPLASGAVNWVNIALAGACFIGAILIRPRNVPRNPK